MRDLFRGMISRADTYKSIETEVETTKVWFSTFSNSRSLFILLASLCTSQEHLQVRSRMIASCVPGELGAPPQQAFCIMDSHMHRLLLLSIVQTVLC